MPGDEPFPRFGGRNVVLFRRRESSPTVTEERLLPLMTDPAFMAECSLLERDLIVRLAALAGFKTRSWHPRVLVFSLENR